MSYTDTFFPTQPMLSQREVSDGMSQRESYATDQENRYLSDEDFHRAPMGPETIKDPEAEWDLDKDEFDPNSPMFNSKGYDSATERNTHMNSFANVRASTETEQAQADYSDQFSRLEKESPFKLAKLIMDTGDYFVPNIRWTELQPKEASRGDFTKAA